MKRILTLLLLVLTAVSTLTSCRKQTEDDLAASMIENIESSVAKGDFRSALDSITILRDRYPKAVNARKRALQLWQDASLLQAQREVEQTDSLLQLTLEAIKQTPTLLEQNMLRQRRDSLQARYDAECGVVRIIRAKQNGK